MVATLLSTALLLGGAAAFPQFAEMAANNEKRQIGLPTGAVAFPQYPGTPNHAVFNSFDAKSQLVSTSGEHEFRMPGPTDVRGPCAG